MGPYASHANRATMSEAIKTCREPKCDKPCLWDDVTVCEDHWHKYHKTNQPCVACNAEDGTFSERGFNRCRRCWYPGQ